MHSETKMVEREFDAKKHQVTTPEILPISKKQKMHRYYEEFSNNKRSSRGAKKLLPQPKHQSVVQSDRQNEFEKLANVEQNGYFGVYHVSICQPDTVISSFENFVQRMVDEQEFTKRTRTVDSHFFDEYSIKNYRSETMNESFKSLLNEDRSREDLNNYRDGLSSSNIDQELMMQIIEQQH